MKSAIAGLEAHRQESIARALDLGPDADKEELVTAITGLVDVFADVVAERDQLRERIDEIEGRVDDAEDRLDDVEFQIQDNDAHLDAIGRKLDAIDDRLDELEAHREERATATDPNGAGGGETSPGNRASEGVTTETPLEQVVALPEHLADGELTANQQRARFVAADVWDYTTDVPAGRTIQAGDLSKVLRAGTDCRGHSQTVDRVIRLLDDLGGDEVEVVERRGQRRVVFTEALCRRLKRLTTRRDSNHDVVTGATG